MAKVTPIQESFAAGEITPKLLGRRSIDGYKSGVLHMHNMIADSRGPAISRPGSRYSQQFDGYDCRIGLMTTGGTSTILFVMTDLLMTITGILGVLPEANFVQNGNFNSRGTSWTSSAIGGGASVEFDVGEAKLNSGGAGRAYIAQQLTVSGVGVHTIILNTDGTTPYRFKIGDTEDSADYYEGVTSQAQTSFEVDIQTTTPWITFVRDSADGGLRQITVHNIVVTDDTVPLEFITIYPESVLKDLFFVSAPSGDTTYILHYNYPPYKVEVVGGVVTFGPVVFTNPPAVWTGTNWPGSGTVFEGRLWLGGTPETPQTFWGSKSGDLENFTTGANADDALEFTISTFGLILWMMGTKNLLIGTVNGEHVVSAEAGVITPTDIQIDQQSAYGSSRVQPVQVGDQIFYVSPDGTKVRALQYEWSADNWLSKDLTFFSEHITLSGIREMSWAPNPNNLLVCTLNNGEMAWLSYERGENVWGWHDHDFGAIVKDTAVGSLNGFSYTVAAIERIDGVIYIETVIDAATVYMDSWKEKEDLVTSFTVVDGLEHLEGETVQVVADGAVSPEQVVTGGEITLPAPANIVQVGLQFTPLLVTLPLESGSPTGSSLAYLKRYNRLIVGLLDSALPLLNGVRPPDRTPSTPMNTVEPNTTGQVSAYQLGWSEGATVTIEQDLPLPLTVLYIGGELPQDVL